MCSLPIKPISWPGNTSISVLRLVSEVNGEARSNKKQVHAPVNGSEANGGIPDPNFSFTVAKAGAAAQSAASFFKISEPALERWNFTWYEDLFAVDANTPSVVRVTSKAYRRVALYEPGEYVATLSYYNGTKTVANWVVRPLQEQKKAKNVILFIGK